MTSIKEEQQKLLLFFGAGWGCVLKQLGNSNVTYSLCTENIHHIFRKSTLRLHVTSNKTANQLMHKKNKSCTYGISEPEVDFSR